VDEVLTREGGRLVSRPDRQLVDVLVIDPPRDPTSASVLRRLLDVLLHSAVALVVGTGLAFLLHALDDRIMNESDAAETAGWPVIGAIPLAGAPSSGGGPFTWLEGMLPRFRRAGRASRGPAPARRPIQSVT
jgi:hypothetical protein